MPMLRQAFRALFRSPFVTIVAVLSLALGIGANAAIFSLFDQLLLRPLPVPDPGRLVALRNPGPKPGSQSCGQAGSCEAVFSYPMFRDLEKGQSVFTGIAAHVLFGANLALRGQVPSSSQGMLVSGSYFPVLELQPAAGRLFTRDDDQHLGGDPIAVLSYDYWSSTLGREPGIVGQTLIVNGLPLTIVGVAPRGFTGTTLGSQPDVFVPISMREAMNPGWKVFENRRAYWAYLFARLTPGVSREQAATALTAVYHPIITDVEAPLQKGMSEQTLERFKSKTLAVESGSRGQSSVRRDTKTPLTVLLGLTVLVLVIACANIANLLLARGARRSMELAVRLSLGASRGRLITQLLTESVMLGVLGGAASLLVARWTLGAMARILPTDSAQMIHVSLETPVVVFTALIALGTGVLFGLFPALHSTRPDLITSIRANAGQIAGGARVARRFRSTLVTAQIALSMALLVTAGLFIKSLANVSRVDLGLRTDHMLTFVLAPQLNGYTPSRSAVFFRRAEEELRALPGVSAVTAAQVPTLAGSSWGSSVSVEGFEKTPDTDDNSRYNEVGAGYFHTMEIPLLAGRDFTAGDINGGPKVAIVNEAFAKKFGLGKNPIGKHMSSGGKDLDMEIVGLVRDSRYSDVKDAVPPVFALPYAQDTTVGIMNFYVRTALPPEELMRTIPQAVAKLDPALPVADLKTLEQQVRESVFLDRMISTLSAAFAALATLLAALGLYGVLAYTVAQRTREIGIRMALGADAPRVRRMVIRQVGWMTFIGSVLGIGAALGLGRAARSLLFGLGGADPVVIGIATIGLASVALVAGYLPALRASRVHPMQALRYE